MDNKKESDAVIRLKAMIKLQKEGKLKLFNRDPNKPAPNYDDIPDDITVYASLNDNSD